MFGPGYGPQVEHRAVVMDDWAPVKDIPAVLDESS